MAAALPGWFTIRTVLGKASYNLTYRYNARMDRWLLDVADANNVLLISGQPILGSWPVFGRFLGRVAGLPNVLLLVVDMTGQGRDPQEDTFLADVQQFIVTGG